MQSTIYSVWGLNCRTAPCCQALLLIRKITQGAWIYEAQGLDTAMTAVLWQLGRERESKQEIKNHLKSILRVIEAVDPDAVLQRRAGQRSKDGQFETFGCCLGDRLSHQGIGAEGFCQDVAGLWVQLDIAWGGEVFLSDHHHILREKEAELQHVTPQSCSPFRQQCPFQAWTKSPCSLPLRLIKIYKSYFQLFSCVGTGSRFLRGAGGTVGGQKLPLSSLLLLKPWAELGK